MAGPWEKYQKAEAGPWDKYKAEPSQQPQASDTERSIAGQVLDKANALASGFNRAYVSRAGLPFNPVDAVANVQDLLKAAAGAPYIMATGKAPPEWLVPNDRRDVVGSGAWIINNARKTGLGRAALDPTNPADEGGYLQAAGGGAGGGVGSGASRAQEVVNASGGAVSALLGKGAYDATGNEALAITAGMTPQAALRAGASGFKKAVRGDEAGRKAMEQRTQDLKSAGIENPSLGLSSGNRLIQGLENILSSMPGSFSIMDKAKRDAVTGLSNKAAQTADTAAPNRGADVAGRAIQQGLKDFRGKQFKDQQGLLYSELDALINPQLATDVQGTLKTLSALNAKIPGAPEVSKQFQNARLNSIEAAAKSDTANPVTKVEQFIRPGPLGVPVADSRTVVVNEPTNKLPYEAVSKLRTTVGNEISDHGLMSDVPRSKWNPLYGALSEDMQGAAQATGKKAENAFNRANDYTRAGIARMERVAPYADATAPEQAFTSLMNTTKENASTLQAVKKSLPESARATVAGTVIDRLGRATPGKQNDVGDVWSPERFLTNWNQMTPKARSELFSGFKNADEIRAQVEQIAKATSMMRDGSAIWANPSGTAPHLNAQATLGALGIGALLNPQVAAAAGAGMGGSNLLARGVTSPRVRDFASRQSQAADILDPRNPAILQQILNIPGLITNAP